MVQENDRGEPKISRRIPCVSFLLWFLGSIGKAKAALGKLLNLMPGLTVSVTRQQVPWKNREDSERYLNGLRKAGLPEK